MKMEQLKSHLNAGRQKCQLSHIHVRFLSFVISVVLPTLPSPSSAVLRS